MPAFLNFLFSSARASARAPSLAANFVGLPICLQQSGSAEISDLSGRSHSVCHFLRIDELSIGFTLTPMAARRVIVRHVSGDDKLFQEEDALTRGNTSADHEDQVIQIVPAEAFEFIVLDDVGGDTAALLS